LGSGYRISIFGLGYVGTIHAIGYSLLGFDVVGYDIDSDKVEKLSRGIPTIYEAGVEQYLRKAIESGRLRFTEDPIEAVARSDITFITVGTPTRQDGSQDIGQVLNASKAVGEALRSKGSWHLVVVKSTVLPGTTEGPVRRAIEEQAGMEAFRDFGLAANPEFLREGSAFKDFFKPDRIVIGVKDERSRDVLLDIYKDIDSPKLVVSIAAAEMIKYASNAFLAVKLSFANEIGNLCKALGLDSHEILRAVGMDHRIGPGYMRTGLGFGGSCLPKDARALIKFSESLGARLGILEKALEVNDGQVARMVSLVKKRLGSLSGRRIGILGLAFKPGTDDVRESRGVLLAEMLLREGAEVHVHDPRALDNARKILGDRVVYHSDAESLLGSTEAVIIATEWPEYEALSYVGKVVFDGRRVEKARREARLYEGLCW